MILTRKKTNRKLYGREVSAYELLQGDVEPPTAAEGLYRMLNLKFAKFQDPGSITTLNGDTDQLQFPPPIPIKKSSSVKESRAPPKTQIPFSTVPRIPPKPSRGSKPKKCIALYDFAGQHEGDLSFKEGDIIWISSENGDWFEGTCSGSKGVFPANHVSLVV